MKYIQIKIQHRAVHVEVLDITFYTLGDNPPPGCGGA